MNEGCKTWHHHISLSLLGRTLTTLSLATRTDCSFCRPSEPLWPQTLVHLILGGSWDELALGRRVKRQGRRTVLDSSSLIVWWVTLRIFTTASALVMPEERRQEEVNQCRLVNEATECYFITLKKRRLIANCFPSTLVCSIRYSWLWSEMERTEAHCASLIIGYWSRESLMFYLHSGRQGKKGKISQVVSNAIHHTWIYIMGSIPVASLQLITQPPPPPQSYKNHFHYNNWWEGKVIIIRKGGAFRGALVSAILFSWI